MHRVIRRVLREGDPRGADYRDAAEWVEDIRNRLAHIRGELEDIGRIEAISEHDRSCKDVAGALTLAISSLHRLVEGERSFRRRAEQVDALWADVAADPDGFVIEPGTTLAKRGQAVEQPWEWRPLGIFERGGRPRG
jgi:hypothetical protein